VGVVRVSRTGDREGERFVSPSEQTERIRALCERDGLRLVEVLEEMDVSGGAPLEKRPGLLSAVERVEVGEVGVIVVAFFDRLVRSLAVQLEVVRRVEVAGGSIVAADVGEVRGDTAARKLSSQMLGMVAEYHRDVTAERTAEAKRRSVARGVAPFPNIPPGYSRLDDARSWPDERKGVLVEAFRRREAGETIMAVREYLRSEGIERSFHGVQSLLQNRFYIGELRFGDLVNPDAHPAIIDVRTFQAVQRMSPPRGRRAKSERLLARLGVLRCGTCGSRLVVGSRTHGAKRWEHYRCPPIGDCPERVTISAEKVEKAVVDKVKELVAGISGSASRDDGVVEAERELERAEAALDAAVLAFDGLDDVPAAREKLLALRETRDAARDRHDELRASVAPMVTVTASGDWDVLTLDEQRAIIRAVVGKVVIAPGRGRDRITVEPRLQ
jgi:site-specific DNA recombinase